MKSLTEALEFILQTLAFLASIAVGVFVMLVIPSFLLEGMGMGAVLLYLFAMTWVYFSCRTS